VKVHRVVVFGTPRILKTRYHLGLNGEIHVYPMEKIYSEPAGWMVFRALCCYCTSSRKNANCVNRLDTFMQFSLHGEMATELPHICCRNVFFNSFRFTDGKTFSAAI
jgi:hypothetical protein